MCLPSRNKPNLGRALPQQTVHPKKRRTPPHRHQHLDSLYSEQKEMGSFRERSVWCALGIYFGLTCPKDALSLHSLKGAEVASLVGSALQCRCLKQGEMNPILSLSNYSTIQSHVQGQ